MKFKIKLNKTLLYSAVENENLDIIKFLLSDEMIDVNILYIFIILCI